MLKPVPDWVLRQIVADAATPCRLFWVLPAVRCSTTGSSSAAISASTRRPISSSGAAPLQQHPWSGPVDAARFLTEDWLGRFPFREAGDLERALLLPLTLLTRRTMIRGGAPLFFITSPEARSGKSLLARCLISAVRARSPPRSLSRRIREEFIKTFDAAALEGQPVIFFNNAANGWRIGTAELDTYVDSDEYSPRILGSSGKRTVPALAIPVFAGNNILAVGDTATRTLEVRLERRKDETALVAALDFTAANRPKILSALAEVLRHEVPSVQAISRFPAWERIVARPLMAVLGASATLKEHCRGRVRGGRQSGL